MIIIHEEKLFGVLLTELGKAVMRRAFDTPAIRIATMLLKFVLTSKVYKKTYNVNMYIFMS